MAYSYEELLMWVQETRPYPVANPAFGPVDYHRMQIERWLWDNRSLMAPPAVDIGAGWRRRYVGRATPNSPIYPPLNPRLGAYTLNTQLDDSNYYGEEGGRIDLLGTLTALPFLAASLGTVICTETLEHVTNLFRAVAELKRVLRPGG